MISFLYLGGEALSVRKQSRSYEYSLSAPGPPGVLRGSTGIFLLQLAWLENSMRSRNPYDVSTAVDPEFPWRFFKLFPLVLCKQVLSEDSTQLN